MAIPTATSSDPHLRTISGVILRRPFGRPPYPCDDANSVQFSSRLLHCGNRWTWGRIRQPSPWAGWQFQPAKSKIPSSRGPLSATACWLHSCNFARTGNAPSLTAKMSGRWHEITASNLSIRPSDERVCIDPHLMFAPLPVQMADQQSGDEPEPMHLPRSATSAAARSIVSTVQLSARSVVMSSGREPLTIT
jgi:hypothetical protein